MYILIKENKIISKQIKILDSKIKMKNYTIVKREN